MNSRDYVHEFMNGHPNDTLNLLLRTFPTNRVMNHISLTSYSYCIIIIVEWYLS